MVSCRSLFSSVFDLYLLKFVSTHVDDGYAIIVSVDDTRLSGKVFSRQQWRGVGPSVDGWRVRP